MTEERVKERLHYDPETGVFTWKVSQGTKKQGTRAGTIDVNRYRTIQLDGKRYYEHRLAYFYMTGKFPPHETDHMDGNRENNRWVNLRLASAEENQGNRFRSKRNTSGLKGVSYDRNKWRAQIGINYRTISLGRFRSPEAAHGAYCEAAKDVFGAYARS